MSTNTSFTPSLSMGLCALFVFISPLKAADWPHWLGANGDNVVATDENFDPNLDNWKIAWKTKVGLGYSTVTTANGRAYTMGHDGDSTETILCFDAKTGKKIWDYSYPGRLIPAMHAGGPNASVTIPGERVYAVSKDGQVLCLTADTGDKVWSVQLTKILKMDIPKWGFGSSPVECKGDILFSAGKTIALDKMTGRPSWISQEDRKAGYGTPVVFTNNGKDYIATMDADGLSILDATNGREIARHKVRARVNMIATTPAVFNKGKRIFIYTSSKSELLRFDGKSLTPGWVDRTLQNALSGSVLVGKTLYGLNGSHKNKKTSLYSRDFENGYENWAVRDYGFASVIVVGDTLLILTEAGELVTAAANTNQYHEISRKKPLDPICRTPPTYADGRIFIRNELGQLICLKRA